MSGILQRFKRHPKKKTNLQRCTHCTCRLGSVTCATAQGKLHNCITMSNTMQFNIRFRIKSHVSNSRGPLSVYLVMCAYICTYLPRQPTLSLSNSLCFDPPPTYLFASLSLSLCPPPNSCCVHAATNLQHRNVRTIQPSDSLVGTRRH